MTEPRKLPRQFRGRRKVNRGRRIPLPGDGEEHGNWFSCWYCGFGCNELEDPMDDGHTRMQTSYSDVPVGVNALDVVSVGIPTVDRTSRVSIVPTNPYSDLILNAEFEGNAAQAAITPTLGGVTNKFVAVQVYSDGTTKLPVHRFNVVSQQHCPSCGTANWRNDH